MKIQALRQLNVSELQEKLVQVMQERFNLSMQKKTRRLETTHKLRDARRTVARLYTLLSEKLK